MERIRPIRRRTAEPAASLDPEDALYNDSGDLGIDPLYDEDNILGPISDDGQRTGFAQLFGDTEEDLRLYRNRTKQHGNSRTAGNSAHRRSNRKGLASTSLAPELFVGSHGNSSRHHRHNNHESYDRPIRFERRIYNDSYGNSSHPYRHVYNDSYERRSRHRSRTPYDAAIKEDIRTRLNPYTVHGRSKNQGNSSEIEEEEAESDEVEEEDSCASDAESNLSFQFSLSSRGRTDQPDGSCVDEAEHEASGKTRMQQA